jgi:predicted ATPase
MQINLLSLTIKNCGALKEVKIDFTDNGQPESVIVLGGANGSGKTTVLELIFALFDLFKIHDPRFITGGLLKNIQLILPHTEYAEIEMLIDGKKTAVFFDNPPHLREVISHGNKHGIVFHRITHDWGYQYSDISEQLYHSIRLNEEQSINFSSNDKNTLPSILYFPHHCELLPVTGEQIHREEVKYQWCYRYQNPSHFPGSLESYLIWLDYAEHDIFQGLIDFLNQLNFEGKTFHIHRKTLSVKVKTRDGNEHGLNELSSGEQNILILLLELRRRLIPGSVVLLDEIENSLHPAFQHQLAQNLLQLQRETPFQLILTTHQPTFVKIFGEKRTRILTEF